MPACMNFCNLRGGLGRMSIKSVYPSHPPSSQLPGQGRGRKQEMDLTFHKGVGSGQALHFSSGGPEWRPGGQGNGQNLLLDLFLKCLNQMCGRLSQEPSRAMSRECCSPYIAIYMPPVGGSGQPVRWPVLTFPTKILEQK